MQQRQRLWLQIAGSLILATSLVPSAFAESRHQQGTSRGSGGHIQRGDGGRSSGSYQPRQRSVTPSPQRFESRSTVRRESVPQRSEAYRDRGNITRERTDTYRSDNANRSDRSYRDNNSYRNGDRNRSDNRYRDNNNGYRGNNNRGHDSNNRYRDNRNDWRPNSRVAPYRGQHYGGYGRVSRYERYHNGYRVWIGGGLYPIFVPFASWRIHPLRIGLYIRFGGYWDPLGYWSVYDYSPYDRYYSDAYRTAGDIRGVVESVDYRRGTVVVNDDLSRQFVTVTMPRDSRMDDLRPGDYVEFSGDWTRNGVFNAYRLDRIEYDRDRY